MEYRPDVPDESDSIDIHFSTDSNVNAVMNKFKQRSDVGLTKYDTTTDRTDLTTMEWLVHLQEELMDATIYIQRLKKDLSSGNISI